MKAIFTHTDFDGVVSATLLSIATNINFIKFLSNKQIWLENFSGEEIISDLPCPWKCKLWFDHHASNLNEMKERGINIDEIPGKFQTSDSCSEIIYQYYKPNVNFPDYFESVVQETNIIDSMKYNSVTEWLTETPIKILSNTTQLLNSDDYRKFLSYLLDLSRTLKNYSPAEMVELKFIKTRYDKFKEYTDYSAEQIKKTYYFHNNDKNKSIAILDLSEFKVAPRFDKNLIYMFEPNTDGVLLINSIFKNNNKTNNLKFSIGINFTKAKDLEKINVADIFEQLEIGGGHPKAAGGLINTESKEEKLKQKEYLINEIINRWYQQKSL